MLRPNEVAEKYYQRGESYRRRDAKMNQRGGVSQVGVDKRYQFSGDKRGETQRKNTD